MVDVQKCQRIIQKINQVLQDVGILDIVKLDSSIYIGGSLPSYIISQELLNKNDPIICNDIDLYTNNYVKTLYTFSKHLGNQIKNIKRTGVNVSFLLKDIPIQIITSEFKNFYNDVLGNYDCTLVSVGFYPFKNELIIHDKFIECLNKKSFIVDYEKSNPKRIEKLKDRADKWFNANLDIIRQTDNADFRPYYKKSCEINSLQDIVSPPNYVQLYYNKYDCINCHLSQEFLLCKNCYKSIDYNMTTGNQTIGKKITILGGLNGFGKIIKQVASKFNNNIYVTTRKFPSSLNNDQIVGDNNIVEFTLGEKISDELMNHILTSDIVILNAYSTLENDESIWTTTIDTFNEELALDKFKINTIGYAKFLKEFVEKRKEQIKKNNLTNDIKMIFMDANESKFEGKLSDGKHLELNMAKTATKQIFYTNANLLASLGVLPMCYDPGWLSYHGISVDKIESKSKYLIPPDLSALALLYYLGKVNFIECIEKKKVIFDCSVYETIKNM